MDAALGLAGPLKEDDLFDPQAILTSLGEVVYSWSFDDDRLVWSENLAQVFALPDLSMLMRGASYEALCRFEDGPTRVEMIKSSPVVASPDGVAFQLSYAFFPQGSVQPFWIEETGRWFAGPDGRPSYAHGVVRVVRQREGSQGLLVQHGQLDALTGQLSRHQLAYVLEQALQNSQTTQENFGFLLCSIDNLAVINTTYGFDIADEVIRAVALRIKARMRGRDVLARYSGNKFAVVLSRCESHDMPVAADRFIRGVMDEVIQTSAGPVNATLTIGGLIAPRYGDNVAEIMHRAHETLDLAKQKYRGGFAAYSPSRERETARRQLMSMTDEVLAALNDRRLRIAYQPLCHAATGAIESYECLARVMRDNGEVMSLGSVIPLFEKLGLIRLVDLRVLELALQSLVEHPTLRLGVNVSADTAADPDWRGALISASYRYPGLAQRLTLEITETSLVKNLEEAKDFIACVKEQGCRVAIDDFGTGHTSFKQLRLLNVDCVKIDGAFIQNIASSGDDRFFVRTLVDLARYLNVKTVAEWVQNEDAARILREIGVDTLQGVFVGETVMSLGDTTLRGTSADRAVAG